MIAETAASRLLRALGFGADIMYPVEVICDNCPLDPWTATTKLRRGSEPALAGYRAMVRTGIGGLGTFRSVRDQRTTIRYPMAAIERKPSKYKLENPNSEGWTFAELLSLLPEGEKGMEEKIHREGLVTILGMLQHADSKAEQQRIICEKEDIEETSNGAICTKPRLMVHDLGFTFGSGWSLLPLKFSKMNAKDWQKKGLWSGRPENCILSVNEVQPDNPTLRDTSVSNEGRAFAACLLDQLTTNQIREIFETSRVDKWDMNSASLDEWTSVMQSKIQSIKTTRCSKSIGAGGADLLPSACKKYL